MTFQLGPNWLPKAKFSVLRLLNNEKCNLKNAIFLIPKLESLHKNWVIKASIA